MQSVLRVIINTRLLYLHLTDSLVLIEACKVLKNNNIVTSRQYDSIAVTSFATHPVYLNQITSRFRCSVICYCYYSQLIDCNWNYDHVVDVVDIVEIVDIFSRSCYFEKSVKANNDVTIYHNKYVVSYLHAKIKYLDRNLREFQDLKKNSSI